MSSGWLHTPRHLQRVWDQFIWKESPEQSRLDGCTLPDTSRECGTSLSRRNLWSNVIWTAAHSQTRPESVGPVHPEGISRAILSRWLHAQTPPESVGLVPLEGISGAMSSGWLHAQTPPESVGPVPLEGISRALLSGWLHTPRHLQRVWDQFPQKESPEQSHPDVCTLPDTSNECGTSSPGRNLQSNLIRMAAHSQTPPESVGPVPPEGISRAILSRQLHTPRHLQRVWDQFLQKESLEQSRPDICTLPDTSKECGTSSSRRNLWSNLIWMAAHSQTPSKSVGPVPPEGISGAMLSRWLHTPRHLQRVWDQFLQKESPEQSHLDGCTLPDTSKECGTSSSRRNLQSNFVRMAAHS